jgi:hypothetical protein
MEQQEIIIRLIKDHLVNTRLINGLYDLGIYMDDYHLHLSDTIFKMMGIPDEDEELYLAYLDWCTKISKTEVLRDQQLLDGYAREIYAVLARPSYAKASADEGK